MDAPKYRTDARACSCPGYWYRRTCKHYRAYREAVALAATESYVLSLASLDVAASVRQVNLDSGYQPAAGTYHAATFWQRREPSSTACEDGGS